ncbi:MAG: 5'-3' exonuclease H3TH domain-containing protein [Planctomycetota bacterium]
MKVHVVDGTFELFRAYFAMPSAQTGDGQEVGATRGLLRSLHSLIRNHGATHIAVAFDTVVESFRNRLFDGYKTGEGIEPELFSQFPLVEEAARALGIVVWSMIEFEADDALATAAVQFGKQRSVEQIVICSPDKDLAQCVNDKVVCWDRIRDRTLDTDGVREKFGVAPASIPDYLALVGDAADGIPGVPRWGAKSAATILARYNHLEDIPPDPADWNVKIRGAAALATILGEHEAEVELYRELATLRRDVPLAESLADLRWRGADKETLTGFCRQIGYERFVDEVERYAD